MTNKNNYHNPKLSVLKPAPVKKKEACQTIRKIFQVISNFEPVTFNLQKLVFLLGTVL